MICLLWENAPFRFVLNGISSRNLKPSRGQRQKCRWETRPISSIIVTRLCAEEGAFHSTCSVGRKSKMLLIVQNADDISHSHENVDITRREWRAKKKALFVCPEDPTTDKQTDIEILFFSGNDSILFHSVLYFSIDDKVLLDQLADFTIAKQYNVVVRSWNLLSIYVCHRLSAELPLRFFILT